MGLFELFRRRPANPPPAEPPTSSAPSRSQSEEICVPEITASELLVEQCGSCGSLLLDCRELYEWRQIRIPGSLHIPMKEIPGRLHELDREGDIVVVCAHGNRSYYVAGYLIQNGFSARSLLGGIVDWESKGGPVENGHRPSS